MNLLSAVPSVQETPLDRFLAEQADLTAVGRFAQRHEAELVPRQARYYRDLIPMVEPVPGEQYGFEVDLDACTGCKACVAACHSLNGLDEGESWRSVTLLRGGGPRPYQQTVTAACHHCVEPACLAGCPVDAYEKDPVTGIVSHLDDQCIGCSYCTLSCPYEVPVYNRSRGIVRKCDMCQGRLAAGEAPACVQACPNGAIAIKVVDVAAARAAAASGSLVPGAPPSGLTVPSTSYVTTKADLSHTPVAGLANAGPARAHPPLAVMLVLTQLAVGAFVVALALRQLAVGGAAMAQTVDALVAVAAGALALGASTLHLGRPRYFYRALIGLRHSWLSREVLAFGAFTIGAVLYAAVVVAGPAVIGGLAGLLGVRVHAWVLAGDVAAVLGVAVAASGLAGVACSVLIYTSTHRASWRPGTVASKFVLSGAISGGAAVMWASLLARAVTGAPAPLAGRWPPLVLGALVLAKLGLEVACAGPPRPWGRWTDRYHPQLRATSAARSAAGSGAVALALGLSAVAGGQAWLRLAVATAALGAIVAGEMAERLLFFTTASRPR